MERVAGSRGTKGTADSSTDRRYPVHVRWSGIVLAERGLNWQGSTLALTGDGLMLLTALCGAIYGVLAQRMLTRLTPTQVAVYVNVNPIVAIILGAILLTEKLTGVFVVGFVAVVVGVLFVNWPRKIEPE